MPQKETEEEEEKQAELQAVAEDVTVGVAEESVESVAVGDLEPETQLVKV